MADRETRRKQLERVRLYLITDARPVLQPFEAFLEAAVAGGVGMVQLRDRELDDAELLAVAIRGVRTCAPLRVPFIVNDRADIAALSGADGVHLGQCDVPPAQARRIVGRDAIVGISTHSPEQIAAAEIEAVDYIGVGPIHATPTKPGRPAVGAALVRYAAAHCSRPFFAIGGIEPSNVREVVAAGGRAVSVLRYVSQASDPRAAARDILDALSSGSGH
ncbi:MAG TPA: thiamine phosphate synthase [Candidatus Eremiobacteraceae bacterium]